MIAFLLGASLNNAAACAVAVRQVMLWFAGRRSPQKLPCGLWTCFLPDKWRLCKIPLKRRILGHTEMWEAWLHCRCGGKLLLRFMAPAEFLCSFWMPSNSLGLGLREAQASQAVLQDPGHRLLFWPPSQHASYAVVCSGDKCLCSVRRVSWKAVHSPLPFLSGWLNPFVLLARQWKSGGCSLSAAPLLLTLHRLPELQHVRLSLQSPGLRTAPAQTSCLCVLLSVLANRNCPRLGWGPFPAAAATCVPRKCMLLNCFMVPL